MHILTPCPAATRIATGRLVQRRDPCLGASNVDQAMEVEVVLVVLLREPFGWELPEVAMVVVTGDEQRRWIECEPAGRYVVRHGARDRIAGLAPEGHEIEPSMMAELFENCAVLVADGTREVHGQEEIVRLARQMWQRNRSYLGEPRRIVQAGNTALIMTQARCQRCSPRNRRRMEICD